MGKKFFLCFVALFSLFLFSSVVSPFESSSEYYEDLDDFEDDSSNYENSDSDSDDDDYESENGDDDDDDDVNEDEDVNEDQNVNEYEADDDDLEDMIRKKEIFEKLDAGRYSVVGDLNLPPTTTTTVKVPIDDGLERVPAKDASLRAAAKYVMDRINEGKAKCGGTKFTSFNITHSLAEPGIAESYLMEVHLQDAKKKVDEIYHVSVHQLLSASTVIHKSTGVQDSLAYTIRSIQPNPCHYKKLAQTFLQVDAHNANPDRTYDAAMHPKFFGKTVEHVAAMYLGSKDFEQADLENAPSSSSSANQNTVNVASVALHAPSSSNKLPALHPPGENMPYWVGPVMDQGSCAACYAYAGAAAVSGRLSLANNKRIDLSVDEILDCTSQCNGGNAVDVFNLIQKKSVSESWCLPDRSTLVVGPARYRESIVPGGGYCGAPCTSTTDGSHSAKWTISGFQHVTFDSNTKTLDQQIGAIKQEIFKNGPIYISIPITDDFMSYKKGIFTPSASGEVIGHHAMAIVGWKGTDQHTTSWTLKNSWSSSWGEKGFINYDTQSMNLTQLWVPTVVSTSSNKVSECPNFASCDGSVNGNMDTNCKCHCYKGYSGPSCQLDTKFQDECAQHKHSWFECGNCSGTITSPGGCQLGLIKAAMNMDTWCMDPNEKVQIGWNFPSQIGSYCTITTHIGGSIPVSTGSSPSAPKSQPMVEIQNPGINTNTQINLCGNKALWSTSKSKCPPTGFATVPADIMSRLGEGPKDLTCYEYLGLNEFGLDRGYGTMGITAFSIVDPNNDVIGRCKNRRPPVIFASILNSTVPPEMTPNPFGGKFYVNAAGMLLYVGPDGSLYDVTSDGNKVVETKDGNRVLVAKDGSLYCVSQSDGSLYNLGPDGALYAASSDGTLYSINGGDGKQLGIGKDGVLYTANGDGSLYQISSDGNLYSINGDGALYSLNGDGSLYQMSTSDGHAISLQKDGNLYTTGGDGTLMNLGGDGNPFRKASDGAAFAGVE